MIYTLHLPITFSAVLSPKCYFVGNLFLTSATRLTICFCDMVQPGQDHRFVGQVPPAVPYDSLALRIYHPPLTIYIQFISLEAT